MSKVVVIASERKITLRVNGRAQAISVPPHRTLLEALRLLGHVDVKCGCEKGDCGACAVLVDGVAIDSCLTLAWTSQGKDIVTVAGIGSLEAPHPLQKAFMDGGGVQCGYCTPGMIIASKSLLDQNPNPSIDEVRFALNGNLCRCTGYTKIIEAVTTAAALLRS
jgi:carbon-monoxide dehydrogenase small subunit